MEKLRNFEVVSGNRNIIAGIYGPCHIVAKHRSPTDRSPSHYPLAETLPLHSTSLHNPEPNSAMLVRHPELLPTVSSWKWRCCTVHCKNIRRIPRRTVTNQLHAAESLTSCQSVAQLLKRFSALYGTRRFTAVFTRSHHWSLS